METTIKQNPKGESVTAISWRAHNAGEISAREMQIMIAMDCAETLSDHPIRPYPKPQLALESYVNGRAHGLGRRDPDLAMANGAWLFLTRQVFTENRQDQDTLEWAKAICLEQGAEARASAIEDHLRRYRSLGFDAEFYKRALMVQRIDSEERKRGERS